jgi:hypothetical protein
VAHYVVTARLKQAQRDDLTLRLKRGEFRALRPFGTELSACLSAARLLVDGRVVWEEEDYCRPPLAEERKAVLDDYFDAIDVEPVERGAGWQRIGGLPRLFPKLPDYSP